MMQIGRKCRLNRRIVVASPDLEVECGALGLNKMTNAFGKHSFAD